MKKKKKQRSGKGPRGELTDAAYLKRLMHLQRELHALQDYQAIALCGNDLSVHVFRGIEQLAAAAGAPVTAMPRDCCDYPLELSFFHEGVTFYQLKSAASLREQSRLAPADGKSPRRVSASFLVRE
ncbi:hypothetical protein GH808_05695 [Acetobacterium fimetarium]|uniref:Uncharacterized protein n=1 Tax=Acetobacterium fimetarium TaxID=52691 RepID=A0ABR6WTI5_9FIRM|nr:hypothetical protein [Acetobacterium fimetarium]MBC3803929.1 hypothetical protein [Acetobacterium fimetarium]